MRQRIATVESAIMARYDYRALLFFIAAIFRHDAESAVRVKEDATLCDILICYV